MRQPAAFRRRPADVAVRYRAGRATSTRWRYGSGRAARTRSSAVPIVGADRSRCVALGDLWGRVTRADLAAARRTCQRGGDSTASTIVARELITRLHAAGETETADAASAVAATRRHRRAARASTRVAGRAGMTTQAAAAPVRGARRREPEDARAHPALSADAAAARGGRADRAPTGCAWRSSAATPIKAT